MACLKALEEKNRWPKEMCAEVQLQKDILTEAIKKSGV